MNDAARATRSSTSLERRARLRDSALARHERLLEIRHLEDRVLQLFSDGHVPGSTHTSQGQEAVAVALGASTNVDDVVTCTYRGHGIALALGMEPTAVLGEIVGREPGSIRGVGGSMHLSDPSIGLLPTFAIVGAGLPVGVGAAVAARHRRSDAIAVAVCGDGATNIGAFHESLNLASVWGAPVLFLVENNLYGEFSPLASTTPIDDLYLRGPSYAIESRKVDGQDVESLTDLLHDEIELIRERSQPRLVEVKTYRFVGHSRGDPAPYRPEGELDRWLERDPIGISRAQLISAGEPAHELDRLDREVSAGMDAAVERVLAAPSPSMRAMFEHVWVDDERTGP